MHASASELVMVLCANGYTVHDPDFRQSERDWHAFVAKVTERLTELDETVPELPVKDVVSAIHSRISEE